MNEGARTVRSEGGQEIGVDSSGLSSQNVLIQRSCMYSQPTNLGVVPTSTIDGLTQPRGLTLPTPLTVPTAYMYGSRLIRPVPEHGLFVPPVCNVPYISGFHQPRSPGSVTGFYPWQRAPYLAPRSFSTTGNPTSAGTIYSWQRPEQSVPMTTAAGSLGSAGTVYRWQKPDQSVPMTTAAGGPGSAGTVYRWQKPEQSVPMTTAAGSPGSAGAVYSWQRPEQSVPMTTEVGSPGSVTAFYPWQRPGCSPTRVFDPWLSNTTTYTGSIVSQPGLISYPSIYDMSGPGVHKPDSGDLTQPSSVSCVTLSTPIHPVAALSEPVMSAYSGQQASHSDSASLGQPVISAAAVDRPVTGTALGQPDNSTVGLDFHGSGSITHPVISSATLGGTFTGTARCYSANPSIPLVRPTHPHTGLIRMDAESTPKELSGPAYETITPSPPPYLPAQTSTHSSMRETWGVQICGPPRMLPPYCTSQSPYMPPRTPGLQPLPRNPSVLPTTVTLGQPSVITNALRYPTVTITSNMQPRATITPTVTPVSIPDSMPHTGSPVPTTLQSSLRRPRIVAKRHGALPVTNGSSSGCLRVTGSHKGSKREMANVAQDESQKMLVCAPPVSYASQGRATPATIVLSILTPELTKVCTEQKRRRPGDIPMPSHQSVETEPDVLNRIDPETLEMLHKPVKQMRKTKKHTNKEDRKSRRKRQPKEVETVRLGMEDVLQGLVKKGRKHSADKEDQSSDVNQPKIPRLHVSIHSCQQDMSSKPENGAGLDVLKKEYSLDTSESGSLDIIGAENKAKVSEDQSEEKLYEKSLYSLLTNQIARKGLDRTEGSYQKRNMSNIDNNNIVGRIDRPSLDEGNAKPNAERGVMSEDIEYDDQSTNLASDTMQDPQTVPCLDEGTGKFHAERRVVSDNMEYYDESTDSASESMQDSETVRARFSAETVLWDHSPSQDPQTLGARFSAETVLWNHSPCQLNQHNTNLTLPDADHNEHINSMFSSETIAHSIPSEHYLDDDDINCHSIVKGSDGSTDKGSVLPCLPTVDPGSRVGSGPVKLEIMVWIDEDTSSSAESTRPSTPAHSQSLQQMIQLSHSTGSESSQKSGIDQSILEPLPPDLDESFSKEKPAERDELNQSALIPLPPDYGAKVHDISVTLDKSTLIHLCPDEDSSDSVKSSTSDVVIVGIQEDRSAKDSVSLDVSDINNNTEDDIVALMPVPPDFDSEESNDSTQFTNSQRQSLTDFGVPRDSEWLEMGVTLDRFGGGDADLTGNMILSATKNKRSDKTQNACSETVSANIKHIGKGSHSGSRKGQSDDDNSVDGDGRITEIVMTKDGDPNNNSQRLNISGNNNVSSSSGEMPTLETEGDNDVTHISYSSTDMPDLSLISVAGKTGSSNTSIEIPKHDPVGQKGDMTQQNVESGNILEGIRAWDESEHLPKTITEVQESDHLPIIVSTRYDRLHISSMGGNDLLNDKDKDMKSFDMYGQNSDSTTSHGDEHAESKPGITSVEECGENSNSTMRYGYKAVGMTLDILEKNRDKVSQCLAVDDVMPTKEIRQTKNTDLEDESIDMYDENTNSYSATQSEGRDNDTGLGDYDDQHNAKFTQAENTESMPSDEYTEKYDEDAYSAMVPTGEVDNGVSVQQVESIKSKLTGKCMDMFSEDKDSYYDDGKQTHTLMIANRISESNQCANVQESKDTVILFQPFYKDIMQEDDTVSKIHNSPGVDVCLKGQVNGENATQPGTSNIGNPSGTENMSDVEMFVDDDDEEVNTCIAYIIDMLGSESEGETKVGTASVVSETVIQDGVLPGSMRVPSKVMTEKIETMDCEEENQQMCSHVRSDKTVNQAKTQIINYDSEKKDGHESLDLVKRQEAKCTCTPGVVEHRRTGVVYRHHPAAKEMIYRRLGLQPLLLGKFATSCGFDKIGKKKPLKFGSLTDRFQLLANEPKCSAMSMEEEEDWLTSKTRTTIIEPLSVRIKRCGASVPFVLGESNNKVPELDFTTLGVATKMTGSNITQAFAMSESNHKHPGFLFSESITKPESAVSDADSVFPKKKLKHEKTKLPIAEYIVEQTSDLKLKLKMSPSPIIPKDEEKLQRSPAPLTPSNCGFTKKDKSLKKSRKKLSRKKLLMSIYKRKTVVVLERIHLPCGGDGRTFRIIGQRIKYSTKQNRVKDMLGSYVLEPVKSRYRKCSERDAEHKGESDSVLKDHLTSSIDKDISVNVVKKAHSDVPKMKGTNQKANISSSSKTPTDVRATTSCTGMSKKDQRVRMSSTSKGDTDRRPRSSSTNRTDTDQQVKTFSTGKSDLDERTRTFSTGKTDTDKEGRNSSIDRLSESSDKKVKTHSVSETEPNKNHHNEAKRSSSSSSKKHRHHTDEEKHKDHTSKKRQNKEHGKNKHHSSGSKHHRSESKKHKDHISESKKHSNELKCAEKHTDSKKGGTGRSERHRQQGDSKKYEQRTSDNKKHENHSNATNQKLVNAEKQRKYEDSTAVKSIDKVEEPTIERNRGEVGESVAQDDNVSGREIETEMYGKSAQETELSVSEPVPCIDMEKNKAPQSSDTEESKKKEMMKSTTEKQPTRLPKTYKIPTVKPVDVLGEILTGMRSVKDFGQEDVETEKVDDINDVALVEDSRLAVPPPPFISHPTMSQPPLVPPPALKSGPTVSEPPPALRTGPTMPQMSPALRSDSTIIDQNVSGNSSDMDISPRSQMDSPLIPPIPLSPPNPPPPPSPTNETLFNTVFMPVSYSPVRAVEPERNLPAENVSCSVLDVPIRPAFIPSLSPSHGKIVCISPYNSPPQDTPGVLTDISPPLPIQVFPQPKSSKDIAKQTNISQAKDTQGNQGLRVMLEKVKSELQTLPTHETDLIQRTIDMLSCSPLCTEVQKVDQAESGKDECEIRLHSAKQDDHVESIKKAKCLGEQSQKPIHSDVKCSSVKQKRDENNTETANIASNKQEKRKTKPETAGKFHSRTLLMGKSVPYRNIPPSPLYLSKPITSKGTSEIIPFDPRPAHYSKRFGISCTKENPGLKSGAGVQLKIIRYDNDSESSKDGQGLASKESGGPSLKDENNLRKDYMSSSDGMKNLLNDLLYNTSENKYKVESGQHAQIMIPLHKHPSKVVKSMASCTEPTYSILNHTEDMGFRGSSQLISSQVTSLEETDMDREVEDIIRSQYSTSELEIDSDVDAGRRCLSAMSVDIEDRPKSTVISQEDSLYEEALYSHYQCKSRKPPKKPEYAPSALTRGVSKVQDIPLPQESAPNIPPDITDGRTLSDPVCSVKHVHKPETTSLHTGSLAQEFRHTQQKGIFVKVEAEEGELSMDEVMMMSAESQPRECFKSGKRHRHHHESRKRHRERDEDHDDSSRDSFTSRSSSHRELEAWVSQQYLI